MTTRNIQHAQILANAASQVVEQYRSDYPTSVHISDDKLKSELERLNIIDPSWQYTLPEEYQS